MEAMVAVCAMGLMPGSVRVPGCVDGGLVVQGQGSWLVLLRVLGQCSGIAKPQVTLLRFWAVQVLVLFLLLRCAPWADSWG